MSVRMSASRSHFLRGSGLTLLTCECVINKCMAWMFHHIVSKHTDYLVMNHVMDHERLWTERKLQHSVGMIRELSVINDIPGTVHIEECQRQIGREGPDGIMNGRW